MNCILCMFDVLSRRQYVDGVQSHHLHTRTKTCVQSSLDPFHSVSYLICFKMFDILLGKGIRNHQ